MFYRKGIISIQHKTKHMSLQVGDKAPNFTLFSSDKEKVTLSDFAGKNVLIHFFPLAFTGVCTAQLCHARDNMAVYNNSNAVVLGISIDSPFVLAKFKEEQNLQFQLLSDFNKEAITAFGVKYDVFPAFELQGVAKRAAFVVDKEGFIRYAEITATPGDLPNFTAIHEVLAQLG